MAAFGAATSEHFAAIGGGHAGAEAMYALTFQVARLESSFHGVNLGVVSDVYDRRKRRPEKDGAF